MRLNPSWQARTGGIDASQFQIDWDNHQARCPMGKQSVYWHEYQTKEYARPVIKIKFRNQDCADCLSRQQCVRNKKAGRSLQIPGRDLYEALAQTRNAAAFKIQWFAENPSSGSGNGSGDQYCADSQLLKSSATGKNKGFTLCKIG